MSGDAGEDAARAAKGRRLAIIMVATAFIFMGVEFAGATYGWSNQTMGLLELGIAAVFVWVMIETYRLWRARQQN